MTRRIHPAVHAGLSLVILLAVVAPVGARMLYVYDLDSLCFLSTDVFEGEVVRRYEAHNLELLDVKLTAVHKGALKPGGTVVVAADVYRKPKPAEPFNTTVLDRGDRLIVFASRGKFSFQPAVPDDAVIYLPSAGGVRLIVAGQVFAFAQADNPGPYVARPVEAAKGKPLTVEALRDQVRDAVQRTDRLAAELEERKGPDDAPWLLDLLAQRAKSRGERWPDEWGRRDYLAELVAVRLANFHDPETLARALPLSPDYHIARTLERGFGTPRGREFLLARVGDAKLPMEARLRYARAVAGADAVYASTLTEIGTSGHRHVGDPAPDNSEYLTRIAKLAHENRRHEELCLSLLRALDWFGQGIIQSKRPPMLSDYRGALSVLKELYDAGASAEVKFVIERITARDPEAFAHLGSPAGKFLSLLRRADPAKYTKLEKRGLIYEYEYDTSQLDKEVMVRPTLVLVHAQTGRRHELPSGRELRGWQAGGGSGVVELPADLPAGRYRVFFELREGGKVVSAGHGFEADL